MSVDDMKVAVRFDVVGTMTKVNKVEVSSPEITTIAKPHQHHDKQKILLPILYLLPGFSAFMNLHLHVNEWEISAASFIGLIFTVPLIMTTNYEIRQDGQIYAKKNKSFFIALIAVLVIRIVLRQFISGLDPASLAMLFFAVAFSYVVPWRIASYLKFRKVKQSQELGKEDLPIKA